MQEMGNYEHNEHSRPLFRQLLDDPLVREILERAKRKSDHLLLYSVDLINQQKTWRRGSRWFSSTICDSYRSATLAIQLLTD